MGTNTGSVYIWDMTSRTLLLSISGTCALLTAEHAEPVRALSFAAPHTSFADHLFVGSDDRTTTVHDVQAIRRQFHGHAITALQGHKGWTLDVQTGGDGRIVATWYVRISLTQQFLRRHSPAVGFGRIARGVCNDHHARPTHLVRSVVPKRGAHIASARHLHAAPGARHAVCRRRRRRRRASVPQCRRQ